jgi:hypothetical protein
MPHGFWVIRQYAERGNPKACKSSSAIAAVVTDDDNAAVGMSFDDQPSRCDAEQTVTADYQNGRQRKGQQADR